jgi:hypothetical protein
MSSEGIGETCDVNRNFAGHCNGHRRSSSISSADLDTCFKSDTGHLHDLNDRISKNGTISDKFFQGCEHSNGFQATEQNSVNGHSNSVQQAAPELKDSWPWYRKYISYSWIWEPEYIVVKSHRRAKPNTSSE